MAINVQYGDISSALGLAQMAGKNQGDQQRFRNFTNFAQLTQNAQDEIDRRNAQQIQNSMATDQANRQFQLSQDQLQAHTRQANAEMALSQKRMNSENDFHQGELGLRSTAINNANDYHNTRADQMGRQQDRLDTHDQQRNDAINNLPPEAQDTVRATGRMPFVPHDFSPNSDDNLEIRLRKQVRDAMADEAKVTYNANDVNQMFNKKSSVSAAIQGKETQFMAAHNAVIEANKQLEAFQQRRLASQMGKSAVQAGTANLNSAAVLKNAQAAQPTPPPTNDYTASGQLNRAAGIVNGAVASQPPAQPPVPGQPQAQAPQTLAPDQAGSSFANPLILQTQQDYDNLPSGSWYELNGVKKHKV